MKRMLSCLMAVMMLFALLPAANASAESTAKGSITATLRFDFPQRTQKVYDRKIKVTLNQGGSAIGTVELDGSTEAEAGGYGVTLAARNRDGAPLTTEQEIGYYDILFQKLPVGSYTLTFQGQGYAKYTSPAVTLEAFSQQIIIGTGDATFTIGDVNNDGTVTNQDRSLMEAALGKTDADALAVYDLNGDGRIDVIDLAYVNHQIGAQGEAKLYDTTLIAENAVKLDDLSSAVSVSAGSVENLFQENSEPVKLAPKESNQPITIPVSFIKEVEMEQLSITAPETDGGIQAGTAEVTYTENGRVVTETIAFGGEAAAENALAIGEEPGRNTIVISLGKRVPVKQVTITVSKVAGVDGVPTYAVVEEIKFLKDIVPENPAPANVVPQNIKAESGSEKVTLTWNEVPNVDGYTVYYGTAKGVYDKQVSVDVPRAVVSGLENLKTYYFVISSTSTGWEGGRSEPVSAVPQPDKRPDAPDFVTVKSMDGALAVSWHKTKNATFYEVYYKQKDAEGEFQQSGGQITGLSQSIGGLTNGVEYLVYLKAGNSIGISGPSITYSGIPEKEEIEGPQLPTKYRLESSEITSVTMTNKNNVDANSYPNGFQPENVIDGDFGTHWAARVWWESSEFNFTFQPDEAGNYKDMNYLVYVPRLDGKYRNSFDSYTIKTWDAAGNQTVSTGKVPSTMANRGYAVLPFEKANVSKLSVSCAQWAGSPTNISMSEIAFYEYDDLAGRVRGLFANDSYTALAGGVTQADIDMLTAQANDAEGYYVDRAILVDELTLAGKLLAGAADALGHVKQDVQSRNGGADSAAFGQSASALQPLGVAALANAQIVVYADIPAGETVSVIPTQFFAEANAWQGSPVTLVSGRNVIKLPKIGSQSSTRGGALYVTYSGDRADEITLQVRGSATKIPTLELSDWYSIDEATRRARIADYLTELENDPNRKLNNIQLQPLNSTEISMPNILLSVPASTVWNAVSPTGAVADEKIDTLYENALAWEDLMHVAYTTQGIDGTYENGRMQSRQNIRYMRMFAGAFMYAAGSHVGVGYGSTGGLVCGKPVSQMTEGQKTNKLFGWGIAHEIGHNMDKLGKAEITNNIYSLMVQTYDGGANTLTSRLEGGKYDEIFMKTAVGDPGAANNVFVQLGMYWQLHLAYDGGDNGLAFYNRFFKAWKSGAGSGLDYDNRVALVASQTAGVNLTEFFTRWGMRLTDETKAELAALPEETRAVWYMNDESRRFRISGGAQAEGATTAVAQLEGEKQVNLTFSSEAQNIQGYEVCRNGKPIAFTTGNSYTDVIGSANNMAFSYTVQAYDLLGNAAGEEADAGEIRVSYDKTIDPSLYGVTKNEDGSVRITLNETAAVSGLKVTGAPESGAFEVKVKCGDGEARVAVTGDFAVSDSGASFISYFKKPGASMDDTRIWTYDADEITITGLPEGAEFGLISYPGDNIAFTDGASVGRLGENYTYETLEGTETIPAGTQVVTGSYRGDPLFSTIDIKGQFTVQNEETGEETVTERPVAGRALLFAEVPEDGETSDISDGFFLFIPDVQQEEALKENACTTGSVLPARIKAELWRTDAVDSADSKRLTSDTVWIFSPSDDSMPNIVLQ